MLARRLAGVLPPLNLDEALAGVEAGPLPGDAMTALADVYASGFQCDE